MFSYSVFATLREREILPEYRQWLSGGHVQAIIDRGGALECAIVVYEIEDRVIVESRYTFPSRAEYDAYCNGLALELRSEGVALWVDTGKVKFERKTGDIVFTYGKTK